MKITMFLLLFLLILHFVHIIEEIAGDAWFIADVYGSTKTFIIIMIVLYIIPLIFFYLFLNNNKFAFYLIFIYISIMILDGIVHVIEMIIMKKYINGAAGLFSGIGFIIVGLLLFHYLRKEWYDKSTG